MPGKDGFSMEVEGAPCHSVNKSLHEVSFSQCAVEKVEQRENDYRKGLVRYVKLRVI